MFQGEAAECILGPLLEREATGGNYYKACCEMSKDYRRAGGRKIPRRGKRGFVRRRRGILIRMGNCQRSSDHGTGAARQGHAPRAPVARCAVPGVARPATDRTLR